MDGEAALPRSGAAPDQPGPMRPPMGGGGPPGGFRGGPGGRINPKLVEGPIASTLIMFALPLLGGNMLQ